MDGPSKKAQVVFVIYFAPSTHCKYDFIPCTSHQWASTWKLRICHITLCVVPSKTEDRILYVEKKNHYRILSVFKYFFNFLNNENNTILGRRNIIFGQ